MTPKQQLQMRRAELIESIGSQSLTSAERAAVQEELRTINANIKAFNVAETEQQLRDKAARKGLGKAQERADSNRAVERMSFENHKPETPGEYIMMSAKRLLKAIERIKPDNRKEFTKQFLPELQTFVTNQKQHIKDERAAIVAAKKVTVPKLPPITTEAPVDDDWKKTWEEQ